jgi:hypothetical protein
MRRRYISASSLSHSAGTSGTGHSSSGHEEPDLAYSKYNDGTVNFMFRSFIKNQVSLVDECRKKIAKFIVNRTKKYVFHQRI